MVWQKSKNNIKGGIMDKDKKIEELEEENKALHKRWKANRETLANFNLILIEKGKKIEKLEEDIEVSEKDLEEANIEKEDYFIRAEQLAKEVVILKKKLGEI